MYTEDQLLPISALQHLAFCPRQWGLIHLEQVWQDNALTAQGNIMHEKVHEADTESRAGLRITRSLRLHSYALGLVGQADVVEFHKSDTSEPAGTLVKLPGQDGFWQPLPVEYKRGKPKIDNCDKVQLCAQVLCLEEMLKVHIPEAAFFYGRPRRRELAKIDAVLRNSTINLAQQLHELTDARQTPRGQYSKKCKSCSLLQLCMPEITSVKKKVDYYIKQNTKYEP